MPRLDTTNENAERILRLIQEIAPMSTDEIAVLTGWTLATTRAALAKLLQAKRVIPVYDGRWEAAP